MRRLVPCAVAVALAFCAHAIAGRWLAARDPIQALLAGDYFSTGALALVLLGARLFLYLLAPAWALHRLVVLAFSRLRGRGPSPR